MAFRSDLLTTGVSIPIRSPLSSYVWSGGDLSHLMRRMGSMNRALRHVYMHVDLNVYIHLLLLCRFIVNNVNEFVIQLNKQ